VLNCNLIKKMDTIYRQVETLYTEYCTKLYTFHVNFLEIKKQTSIVEKIVLELYDKYWTPKILSHYFPINTEDTKVRYSNLYYQVPGIWETPHNS
jgi:hypothetical protein